VALSRVIRGQAAVVAVAHEAARAGALGSGPADAANRLVQRALLVAPGYGLDAHTLALDWDVSRFDVEPGRVTVVARSSVDLTDLPVAAMLSPVIVRAEHVESVDPFRGGRGAIRGGARR
jgi:hypothetical protein